MVSGGPVPLVLEIGVFSRCPNKHGPLRGASAEEDTPMERHCSLSIEKKDVVDFTNDQSRNQRYFIDDPARLCFVGLMAIFLDPV